MTNVQGHILLYLFIYWAYLDCSQILVIINSTAANMGMHISSQIGVLYCDKYVGVGFLNHKVVQFLTF